MLAVRRAAPSLTVIGIPLILVAYLAFKGGGYDSLIRGQIGIAVWWTILLGGALGLLRFVRVGRAARTALVLLFLFTVWTGLSALWSESAARSVTELARVSTYLGVFILGLAIQGRGKARQMVVALATAISLIGGLALLSRLHPQWFPVGEEFSFLIEADERLNYPLDYWNGLAEMIAIGLAPLLTLAISARSRVGQAFAAGVIPALIFAAYLTLSRGGAVTAVVAVVALLLLHPGRLRMLPTLLIAGSGGAGLVLAAANRDALLNGLRTPEAISQGNEMLAIVVAVCLVVGLLRLALKWFEEESPRYPVVLPVERRTKLRVAGAVLGVILVAAIASGGTGWVGDRWEEFKTPNLQGGTQRLESASGNGRYQWWSSAVDAGKSDPADGIGAGAWEFWWARNGTLPGFVRDAHSLYLETFAELGIAGFLLLSGLIGLIAVIAIIRAMSLASAHREDYAALAAGILAFAVAASFDWVWELSVLPVIFLLMAAAVLPVDRDDDVEVDPPNGSPQWLPIGVSLIALVTITIPLLSEQAFRDSQRAAAAGDTQRALDHAERALDLEPYSAAATLQKALVLEVRGDLDGAATAAIDATEAEPTNWQGWLILSRIELERNDADASLLAFQRARDLNPRSSIFVAPPAE